MLHRILIASAIALPFALSAGSAHAGFTKTSSKLEYTWSSTAAQPNPDENLELKYQADTYAEAYKNGFCSAGAGAKVRVKMFDFSDELFEARTFGGNINDRYSFIKVAGSVVREKSAPLNSSSSISYTHELASFQKKIFIEGVPITVKFKMSGKVGVESSLFLGDGIKASMKPNASINAIISAAVGGNYKGFEVKATVSGSLKVVKLSYPMSTKVFATSDQGLISATRELTVSGLSGNVKVNAKAVWNGKTKLDATKQVVSWPDGFSKTIGSTTDTKSVPF